MGCLAYKMHRPLPARLNRTPPPPSAMKDLAECTFRPTLDPNSTRIVEANLSNDASGNRFEVLHNQHREREVRRRELQMQIQEKELVECTFTPRINRSALAGREQRELDKDSFFEQLATPDRSQRRLKGDMQTSEELEIREHCSFVPNTTPRK